MADELLYRAKFRGRNRVETEIGVAKEGSGGRLQRLTFDAIKQSVEEGRVLCHYQPIYDLETGRATKSEALVRLVDEEGVLHFPGEFLPMVRHTTLYTEITKRVLEEVFATLRRIGDHPISVNLEVSDLLDPALFEMLTETLEAHRDIADRLIVEILENEPIDSDLLAERIETIRRYGTRIAIDDFGSGYANFDLFGKLSIDILKIDGSLVKTVARSPQSRDIVMSICDFAHRLKVETVAEFVHDEATYQTIRRLGADCGQGFHLGKPHPDLSPDVLRWRDRSAKGEP
jgi:EAL domain-containing protein (putative c-di-GMP-specific phosphodiesterase class I)